MKCTGNMLRLVREVVTLNEQNLIEEINNTQDQLLHKNFKKIGQKDKVRDRLKRLKTRLRETDYKISEFAKLHLQTATRSNQLITRCENNVKKICERAYKNLDLLNEQNSKAIYTLINTELQKRRKLKVEYLSNYVWRLEDSNFYTTYRVRTQQFIEFISSNKIPRIEQFIYTAPKEKDELSINIAYYNDIKHFVESYKELEEGQYLVVLKELLHYWNIIDNNAEFVYDKTLNEIFGK